MLLQKILLTSLLFYCFNISIGQLDSNTFNVTSILPEMHSQEDSMLYEGSSLRIIQIQFLSSNANSLEKLIFEVSPLEQEFTILSNTISNSEFELIQVSGIDYYKINLGPLELLDPVKITITPEFNNGIQGETILKFLNNE